MSGPCGEPWGELCSAHLDGALQASEAAALSEHTAGCRRCRAYAGRLRATRAAVRAAEAGPWTEPAALAEVERRLAEADDPCTPWRERASASRDGELGPEERDELRAHLASCPACAGWDTRLEATRAALRRAAPLLAVPPSALSELERRLAADASPAGRLIAWSRAAWGVAAGPAARRLARYAAAAAFLGAAVALLADRLPALRKEIAEHQGQDPVVVEERPPAPRPDPGPPDAGPPALPDPQEAPPAPAPDPAPEGAPPPVEAPPVEAPPVDAPTPEVDVEAPRPPGPDEAPPPSTAPHPPAPASQPPALALSELRALIERCRAPALPAGERPAAVESIGAARFDHPAAYEFLGAVLEGALARLPEAEATRRAAFVALGRLDTPRAVAALLAAPLRDAAADADQAALLAALGGLGQDAAVAALADAVGLARLGDARRLVALLALQRVARPAATPGLLAVFEGRREAEVLRREAAVALGRTGDDQAFAPLRAGLEVPRAAVRQGAALGLGALAARVPARAAACVAALDQVAAAPGERLAVAEAAVLALGRTRALAAVEPLAARLEPDERRRPIRQAAQRALCVLAGREPAGVGTAAEWRAFWRQRDPAAPVGVLDPRAVDPLGFRRAAAQGGGVVFVVDLSGSMGPRRGLLEYELRQQLERCTAEVTFTVLFFGDAPKPLLPGRRLTPATAQAKAAALAAVAQQTFHEGTRTALARALQEALRYEEADTIVLLSDGQLDARAGAAARLAVGRANRSRARPARIHAIHLRSGGEEVRVDPYPPAPDRAEPDDVDLMRRLAAEHDGVYARN